MPSKSSRPTRSKPASKPRFKLLVLWKPPAGLMVAGVVALVFAAGGVAALRYSSAAVPDQHGSAKSLVWQDAPAADIGSQVLPVSGQNGPLRNWAKAPQFVYGGGSINVKADPTKAKVLDFFGPANQSRSSANANASSQRAELVADISLQKATTYWFGYDLWISQDVGVARNGWQSIWQIVPQPAKGPSKLWMSVNTNRDGLGIETSTESIRVGDTPYGTWTRIVVGSNLSDSGDAWLEVWQDGKNVIGRRAMPEGAVSKDAGSAVMKAGVYRSPQSWDINQKMANLKIGTTKDAVQ